MEAVNENMVRGLYGSMIRCERVVGYCKCHRCYLTVATLKNHKCLRKQCRALKKQETNDYWRQREQKKLIKKANRLNRSDM